MGTPKTSSVPMHTTVSVTNSRRMGLQERARQGCAASSLVSPWWKNQKSIFCGMSTHTRVNTEQWKEAMFTAFFQGTIWHGSFGTRTRPLQRTQQDSAESRTQNVRMGLSRGGAVWVVPNSFFWGSRTFSGACIRLSCALVCVKVRENAHWDEKAQSGKSPLKSEVRAFVKENPTPKLTTNYPHGVDVLFIFQIINNKLKVGNE